MRHDLEEDENADGGDRAAQEQRYRALFADRADDGPERHRTSRGGRRITQYDLAAVDQTGFDMHEILRALYPCAGFWAAGDVFASVVTGPKPSQERPGASAPYRIRAGVLLASDVINSVNSATVVRVRRWSGWPTDSASMAGVFAAKPAATTRRPRADTVGFPIKTPAVAARPASAAATHG